MKNGSVKSVKMAAKKFPDVLDGRYMTETLHGRYGDEKSVQQR